MASRTLVRVIVMGVCISIGGCSNVEKPVAGEASAAKATGSPSPAAVSATATAKPAGVEGVRADAAALAGLVKSDLAKAFLRATAGLVQPSPRVVYRSADRSKAYTAEAFEKLSEEERGKLQKREIDATTYFNTAYGTPLMYARPYDLLAQAGMKDVAGKKILDFGYGTIGHLKLLASLGADARGVEVDATLKAIYSDPSDQGAVKSAGGADGNVRLYHGRFPADGEVTSAIGEGYDLFISKNTLKKGYIHPAEPVDERMLVKLGVDDEKFLSEVHRVLKPGGRFMIYNISPGQAPGDKPYIPWADGQCPFTRRQLERAGFKVIEFDKVDQEGILDYWSALGLDKGAPREQTAKDLFAWWTLVEKIEKPASPAEKK